MDEWVISIGYIYEMDYYSVLKEIDIIKFVGKKWKNLECIILIEFI